MRSGEIGWVARRPDRRTLVRAVCVREWREALSNKLLVGMTLLLLASISVSVWLWALCLLWLGVFHEAETAVYFSLVSFTTLGFGDIILEKQWRILSGLMAANGLIIFGLTTAVLVDFLSRFRRG